jgi:hypothetical protein
MAIQDDKPRQPFEALRQAQNESFVRSPEFQRIAWLCGLLLLMGLFALYSLQQLPSAAPEAAPTAPARPPTPEEIEQQAIVLSTRFSGALSDTVNGQGFAETSGYRHLLEQVASFSPEELRERTRHILDPAAVVRDPDRWRGEFVRLRAVPSSIWAVKLRQPVAGMQDVWRGVLISEEESARRADDPEAPAEGVVVDFVAPPPFFEPRRDAVEVEGVLYRTVGYENERGRPVVAPYLIGRSLKVLEARQEERSFFQDHTGTLLIGMAVVFGVARLLMYVFHRRSRAKPRPAARPAAADFHAMFENARREEPRAGPRPPARPPPRDS